MSSFPLTHIFQDGYCTTNQKTVCSFFSSVGFHWKNWGELIEKSLGWTTRDRRHCNILLWQNQVRWKEKHECTCTMFLIPKSRSGNVNICKHCRHPENMALYLGDQIRFLHLLNWGTKSSLSTIPHYFMLLWCQNMSTPEKQGFDHINIKKIELVDRIPLFSQTFGS